jgi:hypothetical protein
MVFLKAAKRQLETSRKLLKYPYKADRLTVK